MSDPNKQIKEIFTLAYENHRKNNLKLAEELYKKILKMNSEHVESMYLLATLKIQKRIFPEAIELFNKVLKINANHLNAKHNLAYALIETGKHEEAKKLLEEVLAINPKHLDANYNLGNVFKFFGEAEKAEFFYKKAIEIKPDNSKAYNNLGNILKDLGKFDEAIDSYKKAIKVQFNHANAYHNLGNMYKQLGDFKKAISYYKQSLKYQPFNLETLSTLLELSKEPINENLRNKIHKIIKEKNINNKDIAYGHFLFSKYEERKKNYEKEFDYLLKAHSYYYKWGQRKYDRGVQYWLDEIPNNKELINIGSTKNLLSINDNEVNPIFIVGVPRCGSTLVE